MTASRVRDADWLLVARREASVRLHGRLFWISTAAMVVLIVGGVLAAHLLASHPTTYRVAVTTADARTAVTTASADSSGAGSAGARLVAVPAADRAAAQGAVRAGKVDAVLLPPDGSTASSWLLESRTGDDTGLAAVLTPVVQRLTLDANARALSVSTAQLTAGAALRPVVLAAGPEPQDEGVQQGVSFAFGLLFFMSCQLFGTTIATSVVEEKESRVVEVVLAAIPVRALLIGKIVGNAVLGVAQMAVFAAAGLVAASAAGSAPHLGEIARSSGWFLLFYLVGFAAVCCLFAGLGALASRTQDLQAATAPVQFVITITYLISIIGKGTVLAVASFVPIASTVAMPARVFAGSAPWWQLALALALAVGFAVAAVALAIRIYENAVLRTGARVRLRASLARRRAALRPAGQAG